MRDGGGSSYLAVIKVVGVGGGGSNAVNRMVDAGLQGRRVHRRQHRRAGAPDDGRRRQDRSSAPKVTRGLGAGANPDVGREAAIESRDELKEALKGADMVFVTAGEGGGTGTGAAPVIAELARELGALTVGIVTRPFAFEGRRRADQADARHRGAGGARSTRCVVIPNDRLLGMVERRTLDRRGVPRSPTTSCARACRASPT